MKAEAEMEPSGHEPRKPLEMRDLLSRGAFRGS